ncbi:hypothetical protein HDU76_006258 [Blyttiomyces sp. JEL0837]|nr:hypothetical protein HDU76_006258 [Blyttiomyces sp. JEL0837]
MPDLSNLTKLIHLDLSSNQLSGNISSVSKLTNLQVLDLSNNQLNGPISADLRSLTGLRSINLASNSLSGQLNPDLGNLNQLQTLNLSQNQIQGIIPDSFGNLLELSSLSLENNRLQGAIPDSLSNLHKLTELWVSTVNLMDSNDLSGDIPYSLTRLPYLVKFNVTGNCLTGDLAENLRAENFTLGYQRTGCPGQLSSSSSSENTQSKRPIAIGVTVAFVAFICIVIVVAVLYWKRATRKFNSVDDSMQVEEGSGSRQSTLALSAKSLLPHSAPSTAPRNPTADGFLISRNQEKSPDSPKSITPSDDIVLGDLAANHVLDHKLSQRTGSIISADRSSITSSVLEVPPIPIMIPAVIRRDGERDRAEVGKVHVVEVGVGTPSRRLSAEVLSDARGTKS